MIVHSTAFYLLSSCLYLHNNLETDKYTHLDVLHIETLGINNVIEMWIISCNSCVILTRSIWRVYLRAMTTQKYKIRQDEVAVLDGVLVPELEVHNWLKYFCSSYEVLESVLCETAINKSIEFMTHPHYKELKLGLE